MADKRVNVGFIGCGRVANNFFKAVTKCSTARLAAVSDIDEKKGREMGRKWDTDFLPVNEVCASEKLDVIFVLTPMEHHYGYTVEALQNGKHVLVEKPVSFVADEIRHMIRLRNETGKMCVPGHNYIYLPELSRMKQLISQDEIGIPRWMFMSEIYRMPSELLGKYHGPTVEVLWHAVYLMVAFLGVPEQVQAFSSCFRSEQISSGDEQVMVNARFSEGALCHLFISWAVEDETTDPWTFKVKVLGTDGGLHFSRRDVVNQVMEGRPPWNYPLYDEMFEREVDYFINKCILEKQQPVSTMEDALQTLSIVEAIRTSMAEDRVIPIEGWCKDE